MKTKIYFIGLFLMASFVASCESDDLDYKADFENSRKAWLDFKTATANSYKYTVVAGTWAGPGWETTISVSEGTITERHFKYIVVEGVPIEVPEEELEWRETGDEIGTHENGAAALTLDEVYEKAEEVWLIERGNARIYFESENDGLLSKAGYIDKDCVDDCFIGIKIKNIQGL